jgi:hypothetical protein
MPARTSLAAVRNPVRLLALVCLSSLAAACASSGGGVDAAPTTSVVLETSTQPRRLATSAFFAVLIAMRYNHV